MGKTKRLISLITIETAVILMFISQYVFIFDVGSKIGNMLGALYWGWDYLYAIKYIVALVIMYLIMRDKRSIVLGYIGIAYIIISGCFFVYYFFNSFDWETPVLQILFLYIDPLIIYATLTTVFICFIVEKGKKYFLFFLLAAVTFADMIIGNVFYYGWCANYASANDIYSKFEIFLLEVINTDFYFHWCIICTVFIVETIVILLLTIPERKKESEETDDSKEKNEEIKVSTVVITTLASFLLAFLTILCIIRPLVKICDYSNYDDSFIHKTIAGIPITPGKIEDASPHKIISGYPFDNEEDVEWTYYPNDNMIGLVALTKVQGESEDTIVLAFKYLNSAKNISNTIINYKYLNGSARYGYFSYNNQEIYKKKKIYYVKVTYDNKIVDPKTVSFDKDEDRINIDISDDNIKVTHCNFGEEKTVRKYQNYDSASGTWGDISIEEEEREPLISIGPDIHTELQVDYEKSMPQNPEGVNLFVDRYDYNYAYHNLYGEIETPQVTEIMFSIRYSGKIVGDERIYEEIPEDEYYIEDGKCKLYIKENDTYKDITPEDATVEVDYYDDWMMANYTLKSSLLGQLTEGDYKLEYGGYSDEFTLAIQTYEVW